MRLVALIFWISNSCFSRIHSPSNPKTDLDRALDSLLFSYSGSYFCLPLNPSPLLDLWCWRTSSLFGRIDCWPTLRPPRRSTTTSFRSPRTWHIWDEGGELCTYFRDLISETLILVLQTTKFPNNEWDLKETTMYNEWICELFKYCEILITLNNTDFKKQVLCGGRRFCH